MNALIAFVDYSAYKPYNTQTFWLLGVFGFLTYLVSPLNPMRREEREGLLTTYPLLIFAHWALYRFMEVPVVPYVVHYRLGTILWMLNSDISIVFGAVFSLELIHRRPHRLYGSLWFVVYAALGFIFGQLPLVQA